MGCATSREGGGDLDGEEHGVQRQYRGATRPPHSVTPREKGNHYDRHEQEPGEVERRERARRAEREKERRNRDAEDEIRRVAVQRLAHHGRTASLQREPGCG